MTNVHGPETSLKMAKGIVRSFGQHSSREGKRPAVGSLIDEENGRRSGDAAIEVMVTLGEEGIATKYRFEEPFVLIGRSNDCDLSLADDHVSSRHAYLQRIFGRVVCVDLASSNGTFWPDGRRPFGWFDEEHPICIGQYHLRLVPRRDGEAIPDPEFDAVSFFRTNKKTTDVPKVSLEYLSDSGTEESWILSRTITLVGASSCCKLRLQHESVSRVHCSLILLPEGLWIVDLLGNEGTRVNEARVRSVRLADGDIFKVGKYSFRVNYLPPESAGESNPRLLDEALAGKVISNEFAGQLIDQIMVMQQQFLQQSQQQTEMMLQFFSTLHTQQHELLSQEMARVREIDAELRELRQALLQPASPNAGRQVFNSPEAETAPFKAGEADNLRRIKHVRTAAPPRDQSATVTDVDEVNWIFSEAAEIDRDEDAGDVDVNTAAPEPQAAPTADHTDESAGLPQNGSQDSPAGAGESIEGMDGTRAVEEPQFEVGNGEVDDREEEPIEDEPDQAVRRKDMDHHGWVLSRMHQLERERDNIFRKMVKSIFNSNY